MSAGTGVGGAINGGGSTNAGAVATQGGGAANAGSSATHGFTNAAFGVLQGDLANFRVGAYLNFEEIVVEYVSDISIRYVNADC